MTEENDSERLRRISHEASHEVAVNALTVAIIAIVCIVVLAVMAPLVIMLWRWAIG